MIWNLEITFMISDFPIAIFSVRKFLNFLILILFDFFLYLWFFYFFIKCSTALSKFTGFKNQLQALACFWFLTVFILLVEWTNCRILKFFSEKRKEVLLLAFIFYIENVRCLDTFDFFTILDSYNSRFHRSFRF